MVVEVGTRQTRKLSQFNTGWSTPAPSIILAAVIAAGAATRFALGAVYQPSATR